MLGKLLRNEFKSTYKPMLIIYLMTILSTALGCFLFRDSSRSSLPDEVENVLTITFVLSYTFVVIALVILVFIMTCERFYKSMYSEQGYLTHTLPVSPLSNLNARLITSIVWLLISGVILALSISSINLANDPNGFINGLRAISYRDLEQGALYSTGYHFPVLLLIILLLVLAACCNSLLLVYAALSLGQLASLHKIRAAIGIGIGLAFVEQIIATVIITHIPDRWFSVSPAAGFEEIRNAIIHSTQTGLWFSIGMFSAFAILYYAVCALIVKKHVNLE